MEGVEVDADEVQTLALFSVFGQIIALTVFCLFKMLMPRTIIPFKRG